MSHGAQVQTDGAMHGVEGGIGVGGIADGQIPREVAVGDVRNWKGMKFSELDEAIPSGAVLIEGRQSDALEGESAIRLLEIVDVGEVSITLNLQTELAFGLRSEFVQETSVRAGGNAGRPCRT